MEKNRAGKRVLYCHIVHRRLALHWKYDEVQPVDSVDSPEHWRKRDCRPRCSRRRSSLRALCASTRRWVAQTRIQRCELGANRNDNWKLVSRRPAIFWGGIPVGLPRSCWDTNPGFQSAQFQFYKTNKTDPRYPLLQSVPLNWRAEKNWIFDTFCYIVAAGNLYIVAGAYYITL